MGDLYFEKKEKKAFRSKNHTKTAQRDTQALTFSNSRKI